MFKKHITNIAIVVLAINIILVSYKYIWPALKDSGTIQAGIYRDLEIGASKEDVVNLIINSHSNSRLKIIGFRDQTGKGHRAFSAHEEVNLHSSDEWVLTYPGFHHERLWIYFKENRLVLITFRRNIFQPFVI